MKVTTTIILTILTVTNSLGQGEQINQLTDGLKTGKWLEYDINGKVASIKFYKLGKRKVSAEELFLYNGKVPGQYSKSDSTVQQSIPTGQWITFGPNDITSEILYYNDHGSLQRTDSYLYDNTGTLTITRTMKSKTTYVIGNKDSVEISRLNFYEIKRTNDLFELSTTVKNLSKKEVTINLLPHERLKVQLSKYALTPGDSIDINIRLRLPPGKINELIKLKSNEWSLNLEVNGIGYQLTTMDFDANGKRGVNKTFYYFKTGDEYQMELLSTKPNSKPQYLPLSKQLVEINLSKGTHLLTIVGPSGRKSKEIEIE